MYIIVGLVVVFLVWALFGQKIVKGVKLIIGIGIFIFMIKLIVGYPVISVPAIIILAIVIWREFLKDKKAIKAWNKRSCSSISEYEIDDLLRPCVELVKQKDSNKDDYQFDLQNMPFGRLTSFLNYHGFGRDTEAYYFSAVCSKKDDELREYGMAIIREGVLLSTQKYDSSAENGLSCEDVIYPFSGLVEISKGKNQLTLKYVEKDKNAYQFVNIPTEKLTVETDSLVSLFQTAIDENIGEAVYKGKVITEEEMQEEADLAQEEFLKKEMTRDTQSIMDTVGVIGGAEPRQAMYGEVGNYFNGSRGSGYAAEYGNNTVDRLTGKKVVNAAQQLDDNNRQVKHGADRIVDGVNIQTKYYKTASESIGAAFEKKRAVYINKDGSMMQIEVPRDQYDKACQLMQKRIDSGQVPGANPGDDPRKYVRKGTFTYASAHNIAASGTIESLCVDFGTGIIASSIPAGISVVIVFSIAIWNGEKPAEAAKAGLVTGLKVFGKGALIYTLTMQLSRSKLAIPLSKTYFKSGEFKGVATIANPAFTISEKVASSLSTSTLAKSSFGKSIRLDKVTGRAVTSGTITAVVVFGPDICRAVCGRISTKQLFKNSAVGAAGIGGSILGQVLIPIPVVGAMAGGMVASFMAKSVLDAFVEDDAKQMFQILKEEFLDSVMEAALLKEEFEVVLNKTLLNGSLPKILQEMYMSKEYRKFARDAVMNVAVLNVMNNRVRIEDNMIIEGFSDYVISEVA